MRRIHRLKIEHPGVGTLRLVRPLEPLLIHLSEFDAVCFPYPYGEEIYGVKVRHMEEKGVQLAHKPEGVGAGVFKLETGEKGNWVPAGGFILWRGGIGGMGGARTAR